MLAIAVILGAGYSHVAGLPLAGGLLTSAVHVPSRLAAEHWGRVRKHFASWQEANPDGYPGEYLGELYRQEGEYGRLWLWTVQLIAATLATSPADTITRSVRYTGLLSRPNHCAAHTQFWDVVLQRSRLVGVVTLNYDLLAERSLRHRPMGGRPGCYYAGFSFPQVTAGAENPYRPSWKQVQLALTGSLPVAKLHGSLNWAVSHDAVLLYPDPRPAFRSQLPCAIIPPIPEKETPHWLASVWEAGMEILAEADMWLVCGYSLPAYDIAIPGPVATGSPPLTEESHRHVSWR